MKRSASGISTLSNSSASLLQIRLSESSPTVDNKLAGEAASEAGAAASSVNSDYQSKTRELEALVLNLRQQLEAQRSDEREQAHHEDRKWTTQMAAMEKKLFEAASERCVHQQRKKRVLNLRSGPLRHRYEPYNLCGFCPHRSILERSLEEVKAQRGTEIAEAGVKALKGVK